MCEKFNELKCTYSWRERFSESEELWFSIFFPSVAGSFMPESGHHCKETQNEVKFRKLRRLFQYQRSENNGILRVISVCFNRMLNGVLFRELSKRQMLVSNF